MKAITALRLRAMGLDKLAIDYSEAMMPDVLAYAIVTFKPHYHQGQVTVNKNDVFEIMGSTMPKKNDGFEDPFPDAQSPAANVRLRARREEPPGPDVYFTADEVENYLDQVPLTAEQLRQKERHREENVFSMEMPGEAEGTTIPETYVRAPSQDYSPAQEPTRRERAY